MRVLCWLKHIDPAKGSGDYQSGHYHRTNSGWSHRAIGACLVGLAGWLSLASCSPVPAPNPREIVLQQSWELESGDIVAGHLVAASLGDISIYLGGDALRAPFSGEIEQAAQGAHCIYFSTPEIPAYLFRFCGLNRPHLGPITFGHTIGSGDYVHFATLRRQPDGTWAIVEPSQQVLEKALEPPLRSRQP